MERGRSENTGLIRRLRASLRLPRRKDWLHLLKEAAWLVPLLLLIGFAGGLMTWAPRFDAALLKLAAIAFVAPAFGEELLFRAALLPRPNGSSFPIRAAAISTLAFVIWHPLQAPIFGPHWAAVMLNPWFLCAVAASGIALSRLYWKTGSIWPCVLLHWLVVVGWKALLGGPSPWVSP